MRDFILADNQFITCEGISTLLRRNFKAHTIVKASTRYELKAYLKVYPSAVVILDYSLFDFDSPEQMLIVKAATPDSSWILFSDEMSELFLRRVLLTDRTISVVMKQDSGNQIKETLRNATKNNPYICESAQYIFNTELTIQNKPDKLTASEKIILHEIAMGKTTKEIAYDKNLSFHTVNSHRKNIFRKLEINNMHEAIKYAIRAGIFDVAEYYI